MVRALIVGASGYNGGNIARRLAADGHTVRGLVRDPARAAVGLDQVVRGDVVTGEGLRPALDGIDVAFYFVHALDAGRGTDELDVRAASAFVRAARAAGLPRGVFFTTLAAPPGVKPPVYQHNRLIVEEILLAGIPGMTAVRAGMVLGAGSRGPLPYLRLVQRSPILPLGPWRRNRVAVVDAAAATESIYRAGVRDDLAGRSLDAPASAQPTHEELVWAFVDALGLRHHRAVIPMPASSPRLDARLLAAVTGQSYGFCRYLAGGTRFDYVIDPARAEPLSGITPAPMSVGIREVVTAPRAAFRTPPANPWVWCRRRTGPRRTMLATDGLWHLAARRVGEVRNGDR